MEASTEEAQVVVGIPDATKGVSTEEAQRVVVIQDATKGVSMEEAQRMVVIQDATEEAQRVVMIPDATEGVVPIVEAQRVVVIQDASKRVSMEVVRRILEGFSLKAGDTLALISVLHQVNNPMGYKIRVDSSIFGANQKIVDDEIERKKKEFEDDSELVEISKLYAMQKIELKIEVHAGPSPKIAALEAVQKLQATWVILDRQLKKDKRYFLEKLSCGISGMKRDNKIEVIRGPKPLRTGRSSSSEKRFSFSSQVSYDEMLPGTAEDQEDDLFSIQFSAASSLQGSTDSARSSLSEANSEKSRISIKETAMLLREETNSIREKFPFESNGKGLDQKTIVGSMKPEDDLVNIQICTICKNVRPITGQKSGIFSYGKLVHATNGFSRENLISEGAYEVVFRGQLNSRLNIAVKLFRDLSSIGEKKFKSEIQILEKTRHKNVVMLLGSCSEKSYRLLVYEYTCNGSLDQHISGQNQSPLRWEERMKIAEGLCRGLSHLHENRIIHRDVTPTNVLLTHDFEAVLGGFGLARTLEGSEKTTSDCSVVGSFGYLAPEYAETGKATMKTDVYSLGMVLLQLISGRSITDDRLKGKSLLQWARPLMKEKKCSELIDPQIADSHDHHQFMLMVQLTEKCLRKDPEKRLSMTKVVSTIEHIIERKGCIEAGRDEDAIIHLRTVIATPVPKQARDFFQVEIAQG